MIRKLFDAWRSTLDDAPLSHVPVKRGKRKDWREAALQNAAIRHGKPFKVGADGLPREVLDKGKPRVVGSKPHLVTEEVTPATPIKRKKL